MDFAAVDFRPPNFNLPDQNVQLTVAVLPNDFRLMPPSLSSLIRPTSATGPGNSKGKFDGKFTYVLDGAWYQNWHRFRFTGLKPKHHYAVVIYGGTNYDSPFYRYCFLAGP